MSVFFLKNHRFFQKVLTVFQSLFRTFYYNQSFSMVSSILWLRRLSCPLKLFFFMSFLSFPLTLQAQGRVTQKEVLSIKEKQKQADKNYRRLKEERKTALKDLESLQKTLALNAAEVQKLENSMTKIEIELGALKKERKQAKKKLVQDHNSLRDLLAALQRLEQRKPPALIISPDDITKAARTAGLIAEMAPLIEGRAQDLKKRLSALSSLEQNILKKQENLKKSEENLHRKHQTIKEMIAAKKAYQQKLQKDTAREAQRVADLAKQARSLSDLLAKLQQFGNEIVPRLKPKKRKTTVEPRLKPELPTFSSRKARQIRKLGNRFLRARGKIIPPTTGKATKRFGYDGNQGITFRTRRKAQIIAPFDGYIEFAGVFGNYGQTLILNVGGGYHILLTGLASLTGQAGQTVIRGEPLGEMSRTDKVPELYLELRRQGEPVNPMPWLDKKKLS